MNHDWLEPNSWCGEVKEDGSLLQTLRIGVHSVPKTQIRGRYTVYKDSQNGGEKQKASSPKIKG